MYKFLFLDLDDTILDFHKAERIALAKTFRSLGVDPTEELLSDYHRINRLHWEMLERGELTRDQVLVRRFQVLFDSRGLSCSPEQAAKTYETNLSIGHYFLPGAEEAMKLLASRYRLFLASNGTASVQDSRMKSADLYPYFEQVFISQEVGFNKPSKEYFDACFARIPGFRKDQALMIGDSLTSDIRGANLAGIDACWINPDHAPRRPEIRADLEAESLLQAAELLDSL